ncbi:hypothetical protein ANN_21461 [Periplaneta americana]|uniref:Uncharacterized protein n=1 Tax=Periplaneta americana TaxID=6978 RepID=A0ABQ8SFC2_PERAM|nr:hypothetical protein ANN_21461 [Periplaneta americana]
MSKKNKIMIELGSYRLKFEDTHFYHLIVSLTVWKRSSEKFQKTYMKVDETSVLGKDWDICNYKELSNNLKPINGISEVKGIQLKKLMRVRASGSAETKLRDLLCAECPAIANNLNTMNCVDVIIHVDQCHHNTTNSLTVVVMKIRQGYRTGKLKDTDRDTLAINLNDAEPEAGALEEN